MTLTAFFAAACMMLTPHAKPAATVTGDYVEVRTASVFAGPCHYNGEVVSAGRDALLAMNISTGKWNGVDLSGVRVMAETSGTDNLGTADAVRRSELVIDKSATDAQARAVTDLINTRYHGSLGEITSVRRAGITFAHTGTSYSVTAPGFASYKVDAMPNNECCRQPNLVWYSPLVALTNRKVGYTKSAVYESGSNSELWQRADENSAFYGTFAF